MSKAPSEPRFVKIVDGPTPPSGVGFGYVMLGIISILLLVANTVGFIQALMLPELFGLALALLTLTIKLYMVRPRPAHERASSSGLERMMLYLLPAFLSTLFSAIAIYSLIVTNNESKGKGQPTEKRWETALVVIEDYYHLVRTKIRNRLELDAARLSDLNEDSPSLLMKQEVTNIKEEQQVLRSLLRQAAIALRPNVSNQTNGEDSEDEIDPKSQSLSEAELRRMFEEAASLHKLLPDFIRDQVEAPKVKNLLDENVLGSLPERFFRDTLKCNIEAIGCWAVPAILEIFTIILVLANRPRD